MQGSTSKLRNVFGEASKEKFEDVKPNETSTEGSLIDANAHFIAVIFLIIFSLGFMVNKRWRLCWCFRRYDS